MSASDYVTLRDGRVIPVPVLARLWKLEERGVKFRLDGDGVLVGPRRLVDADDLAFIREHKPLIVSILTAEVTA